MRTRGEVVWMLGECDVILIEDTTGVSRSLPGLKCFREEDLEDFDVLHLEAVVRFHNQKDVGVGLLSMHIALHHGDREVLRVRPDAESITYMGSQEGENQSPFQAATLPAQQVVTMRLRGVIKKENAKQLLGACDRARLIGHLSNGNAIKEDITRWV